MNENDLISAVVLVWLLIAGSWKAVTVRDGEFVAGLYDWTFDVQSKRDVMTRVPLGCLAIILFPALGLVQVGINAIGAVREAVLELLNAWNDLPDKRIETDNKPERLHENH